MSKLIMLTTLGLGGAIFAGFCPPGQTDEIYTPTLNVDPLEIVAIGAVANDDDPCWGFAVEPKPLSEQVLKGLNWLIKNQHPNGGWSQGEESSNMGSAPIPTSPSR